MKNNYLFKRPLSDIPSEHESIKHLGEKNRE